MKKILIFIMIGFLLAGPAFGALKPKSAWKRSNYGNFSLPYAGTSAERDKVPSGVWVIREGDIWYETTNDILYVYDGTNWDTVVSPSGAISLDEAYDAGGAGNGKAINVDTGAIALTASNAADNDVLTLVQSDTGTTSALVITNAGSGSSIEIDGTSGNDIEGTGDVWAITTAGAATLVGITNTGDMTWTNANYDILLDVSADQLEFQDDAQISFGTGEDVEFYFDATQMVTTMDDLAWHFGVDGGGGDVIFYTEAASSFIMIDEDLDDLVLDAANISIGDGDQILFGDALGTGDFSISDEADVLVITEVADGTGAVAFGMDDDGVDVYIYTEATGNYILFDESGSDVDIIDVDIGLDDDAILQFGAGDDFTVNFTDGSPGVLTLTAIAAEDVFQIGDGTIATDIIIQNTTRAGGDILWDDSASMWEFGIDDVGADVAFFGDTASSSMNWDASANTNGALIFDAADIELGDTDFIEFGDTTDATIQWNASALKIDAVTTTAGDAIIIETTDGGIMLNADDASNGDIELNAADDIILTSTGAITVTNGTAITVSGDVDVDGVITTDGLNQSVIVVPDGAAYDVLAANTGIVHVIPGQTADITMDLPAEAAGLYFEFVYVGGAEDAQDWTIDSENNTNYFIGGLATNDDDDGDIAIIYSDGSDDSICKIDTPNAGTVVRIWCNGTQWYISGVVYSGTDTAVAFSNL